MVKTKSMVPLLVGLAVGFYAVKMGVDLVKRAQGANPAAGIEIVVAREFVPVGTAFTEEMVKLAEVPRSLVPARALESIEDVVGRVSSFSLRPGGYVSEATLAPPGTTPALSVKIPKGFRAVAVEVDESSSVAGFLNPGSWVDVIAVMTRKDGKRRETISRTILEDVQVVAVGQEAADSHDRGAKVTRSVTMLVKPKDGAVLHLAATKGTIRLALRHQMDERQGERGFASESGMLGSAWEPDQNRDTRKYPKAGEWWAGLAVGLVTRIAMDAAAAAPSPPDEPQEKPARPIVVHAPAPLPWTVTVLHGEQAEEWIFASVDSTELLKGPSGGKRKTGAKRRAPSGPMLNLQWPSDRSTAVGKPFKMRFVSTSGRSVDVATMRGKVVLVDFWATWCGPCVASVPELKSVYEKYRNSGLEVIGVSLDTDRGALKQFVSDYGIPWPQYFDGKGWNNAIAKEYGVKSIPTMYLIDKRGNLRDKNARYHLDGAIAKLLNE